MPRIQTSTALPLVSYRALAIRILLGICAFAVGDAATAERVRLVLLSPSMQFAAPGELLPVRFKLRVERADGAPVPGAHFVYGSLFLVLGEPTYPFAWYGGFEPPDDPDWPFNVEVTTGSDGTATLPGYRAGRPVGLPVVLSFTPYLEPQTTQDGIVIDGISNFNETVTTVRIGGAPGIPAVGAGGMATLVGLLAVAGLWTMRLRRRRAVS